MSRRVLSHAQMWAQLQKEHPSVCRSFESLLEDTYRRLYPPLVRRAVTAVLPNRPAAQASCSTVT